LTVFSFPAVAWTAMIVAWILVGLPLGPDATLRYPAQ